MDKPKTFKCDAEGLGWDEEGMVDMTQEQIQQKGYEPCGVLLRATCDHDVYVLLDEKKHVAIPLRTD